MFTLTITEKTIDIAQVIRSKSEKLYRRIPRFIIRFLKKILHEDELNAYLYKNKNAIGVDFATEILKDFGCRIEVTGLENIHKDGRYIIAANHPLGGLDGMAIISRIGAIRPDILFPVNDFLMFLPNLRPIFIPINKTGNNATNQEKLKKAFESDATILYFPSGLCSRKQKGGKILDLEWKKTFVNKALENHRDIIPVYIDGKNSIFFYNFARLRSALGIRFNIEQLFLVNEMFKQKGRVIKIVVGKPIPYTSLNKSTTALKWAERIKIHVYSLAQNPEADWVTNKDSK